MAIVTVGIDLAKSIFAIHGVDEVGKAVLVKPKVHNEAISPYEGEVHCARPTLR